ncbi:MAG: metallophosphoesterase, partial [Candidatus Brocadiales bacterium]
MEEVKRIAVISDLHLGEEECLLNDLFLASKAFSEVNDKFHKNGLKDAQALQTLRKKNIEALRDSLRQQGEIDELIILGDFLDYALAPLHQALGNARSFFSSILSGTSNIKKIVLIPGNHDYHLWQLIFEQQVITDKDFLRLLPDPHEYVKWMADQDSTFLKGRFTTTFLNAYLPDSSDTVLQVRYPHIWRKVGD